MSSNNELDIIEDDQDDADLIDASEADVEKKPLRKVVYEERVLIITFNISKQSVSCDYCIKLPNGNNKSGKFSMKHSNNGYEDLEEKVNPDWTKSEIYIPGCDDVVSIVRKRRAIKIECGGKTIAQKDTRLNDEIHGGAGSWLDNNEWNDKDENKFVKSCNRKATRNRFRIKYA